MALWYGFNLPFLVNGRVLDYQEDERIIKNDLIQLLLTSPGERVMRPQFGTKIRPMLFNGITNNSLIQLQDNVKAAIAQYEPRITVNSVNITSNDDNSITIQLQATLNIDPSRKLSFELPLSFKKAE